jgi:hypothetical protein
MPIESTRSWWVAFILSVALGPLGAHRFYTGKIGTGVVWLLTAGCFAIGWIVDAALLFLGKFADKQNRPIVVPREIESNKTKRMIIAAAAVLYVLIIFGIGSSMPRSVDTANDAVPSEIPVTPSTSESLGSTDSGLQVETDDDSVSLAVGEVSIFSGYYSLVLDNPRTDGQYLYVDLTINISDERSFAQYITYNTSSLYALDANGNKVNGERRGGTADLYLMPGTSEMNTIRFVGTGYEKLYWKSWPNNTEWLLGSDIARIDPLDLSKVIEVDGVTLLNQWPGTKVRVSGAFGGVRPDRNGISALSIGLTDADGSNYSVYCRVSKEDEERTAGAYENKSTVTVEGELSSFVLGGAEFDGDQLTLENAKVLFE